MARRYYFDRSLTGLWAECDGGSLVEGGPAGVLGAREFFRGRLTGLYFEEGEPPYPPWRWYELADLVIKPPGYLEDTVWCEEGFLFIVDEPPVEGSHASGHPPPGL
jgi:hypothetical protein